MVDVLDQEHTRPPGVRQHPDHTASEAWLRQADGTLQCRARPGMAAQQPGNTPLPAPYPIGLIAAQ